MPAFFRSAPFALSALAALLALAAGAPTPTWAEAAPAAARAALTVTTVKPLSQPVADSLPANGNVAAWQEAIVGAEVSGLRLADVAVEVGEAVRRGQVLARFAPETVEADLAQARASLAEAEANASEAAANAQRARALADTAVLSAQQMQQYLTAEQTAAARVAAQKAAVQAKTLRLAQTQVLAPDDGLISARSATLGAVAGNGQELFRLIRGGRLEWRAEVAAADLGRLRVGQAASITTASGLAVAGKVRKLGPTVDLQTRNAVVYVDLLPGRESDVRAGMFARGEFRFDSRAALTLPASALLLRDGFQCVMVVSADNRVRQTRVKLLARQGDRIAIEGVAADARVVERGAAFLNDGDTVKVVGGA